MILVGIFYDGHKSCLLLVIIPWAFNKLTSCKQGCKMSCSNLALPMLLFLHAVWSNVTVQLNYYASFPSVTMFSCMPYSMHHELLML